jgi:hypothetical protein
MPNLPILGHPDGQSQANVQVAPGRSFVPFKPTPGQVLMYDLVPVGDMFRPVARVHDQCVLIGPMTVKRLRLGIEYKALRTLIVGGFVEGGQLLPRRWMVNLSSYFAHVERCKADPLFWEKPENLRRYRDARMIV